MHIYMVQCNVYLQRRMPIMLINRVITCSLIFVIRHLKFTLGYFEGYNFDYILDYFKPFLLTLNSRS